MITACTREVLDHLRQGDVGPADQEVLANLPANDLIRQLRSAYPFAFQERQVGRKREISLAGKLSIAADATAAPVPNPTPFPLLLTLAPCVMVSAEENTVTGLSFLTHLSLRQVREPEPGLAIESGPGCKLDRTVDGWRTKPLHEREVVLSHPFLRQRGWKIFPGPGFLFEAFPALRDGLLA